MQYYDSRRTQGVDGHLVEKDDARAEHSRLHLIGKLAVRLPAPEDATIMKAVVHRPQDLLLRECTGWSGCPTSAGN